MMEEVRYHELLLSENGDGLTYLCAFFERDALRFEVQERTADRRSERRRVERREILHEYKIPLPPSELWVKDHPGLFQRLNETFALVTLPLAAKAGQAGGDDVWRVFINCFILDEDDKDTRWVSIHLPRTRESILATKHNVLLKMVDIVSDL